jgi:hypothetical protein
MVIDEIKKILEAEDCSCYSFDENNLKVTNNLSIEQSRYDDCNNRVFTQITGILLENDIQYEVSPNNDILIIL